MLSCSVRCKTVSSLDLFYYTTDHAPLQWLSAQKMEGMLSRWALAMQEYDFQIVYRKGALNTNADALSRLPVSHCAITQARPLYTSEALRTAQLEDSTVSKVLKARQQSTRPPDSGEWLRQPLQRYRQFWSQLTIIKGVVCREYTPNPMSDAVIVPIPSIRKHCSVAMMYQQQDIKVAREHWPDCERKLTGLAWPRMWRSTVENANGASNPSSACHSVHPLSTCLLVDHGRWWQLTY